MDTKRICHTTDNDFLDALDACLSSGLCVWLDGILQTEEALFQRLLQEEALWEGTCLQDVDGELQGISFTTY